MDDLISRQAAIDALKRKQDDGKGDLSRFYNTIIQYDIEAIMQLPPIQPEIVRCEYCKHRDPEDKKCDCGHDIEWQLPRRNDWFCADGER